MSNEMLKVFENEEFGRVRTLVINDNPWFVGKDVAEILGYSNTKKALADHVDPEDKMQGDGVTIRDPMGREQRPTVINESGLYSLILSSKLPKAKEFKHWVTSEVLPSIRKTGGYVSNDDLFIDTYLPNVNEETKNLFRLNLQTIRQLNGIVDIQKKKIEQDKPLVDFANHVSDTSDLIDIGTLAKLANDEDIPIGRNKLFEWLRRNCFLMSKGEHKNEPYQKCIDNGWFVVKEYTYKTPYGNKIRTKAYVTGRGQIYIIEKLRKDFT